MTPDSPRVRRPVSSSLSQSGAGGFRYRAQVIRRRAGPERTRLSTSLVAMSPAEATRSHYFAHARRIGTYVLGQDLTGQVCGAMVKVDQCVHCQ